LGNLMGWSDNGWPWPCWERGCAIALIALCQVGALALWSTSDRLSGRPVVGGARGLHPRKSTERPMERRNGFRSSFGRRGLLRPPVSVCVAWRDLVPVSGCRASGAGVPGASFRKRYRCAGCLRAGCPSPEGVRLRRRGVWFLTSESLSRGVWFLTSESFRRKRMMVSRMIAVCKGR
jgi:hypothetical protein